MTRPTLVWTAAALTLVLGGPVPAGTQAPPVVLTGARILDVAAGAYVPAAAVVLSGGRITAIHTAAPSSLPEGGQRIDLAGATLVPGLGDMAVAAAPRGTVAADYFYLSSLAYGVTMVRTIDVPAAWGAAQRERATSGDLLAPNLWTSGPPLEQRGLDRRAAGSLDATGIRDWASAVRAVEAQARATTDWVRLRGSVAPDLVKAVVSSSLAARVRTSGEAFSTPMAQMARLGVHALDGIGAPGKSVDELEQAMAKPPPAQLDEGTLRAIAWEQSRPEEIRAAIGALVKARTVLVSMLDRDALATSGDETLKRPEMAALPGSLRAGVAARAGQRAAAPRARKIAAMHEAFVRDLAAAGGAIVTGTGADASGFPVPGAGLHAELARLVAAGLTPIAAIRAATADCAALMGAGQTLGRIAVGYRADLFAVDGDPLQQIADLSRIRLIVRNGEVLKRQELLMLAARAAGGR